MPTLTVSDANNTHIINYEGTPTLQQVLEHNGILMPHPCGGRGVCAKCRITVSGAVSAPDDIEQAAGFRLSCRTKLLGDATVSLCSDTHVIAESSTLGIKGDNTSDNKIGAAVDIGTTTVALSVFDLSTGNCLASATALNPQSTVAADVIGRIDAAMHGHSENLQTDITSCIKELARRTGYLTRIDRWSITGNTTMLYLFTGRIPKTLSASPFEADCLFDQDTTFLGKPLYLPGCIHAFVGADITCAALNSGMCDSKETALLCDIGTNGELALWKNGALYTASTAAGPAFEGAGISCGCQSIPGAIERVTSEDNTLHIQTIENAPPVGLCGSGVIDAVACLLDKNAVDETGFMEEETIAISNDITVNQEDIRSIQLAKAAIAAGIKTLLELTDTSVEEINTLYLAGGFGSHLHIDSAVRIGLLPKSLQKKSKVIGNAALKGAASFLTDDTLKEKARYIISEATYSNLGSLPEFYENYINEMNFPKS